MAGIAVALTAVLAGGRSGTADPNLPAPPRVERFLDLLREVSPLTGDLEASAFRRQRPPAAAEGSDRLDRLLGAPRTLYLAGGAEARLTIEGSGGTIVVPRPLAPDPRIAEDWAVVLEAVEHGDGEGEAIDLALSRIEQDPIAANDFRTHLLRGLVRYKRGESSALASFEEARRSAGNDVPSRTLAGLLHLRSGSPERAIEPLVEATRIAPRNTVVRALLADANLRAGRPAQAVRLLEPLVRADPDATRQRLLLARSLIAAHRPRAALVHLELVSGDAEIQYAADCLAARAHLALDAPERALERARSAALIRPKELPPGVFEVIALTRTGRLDEAAALTLALTKSHPEAPAVWRRRALVCEKRENLAEAETAARRWLSLSPGRHAPVLLLARILLEAGKPETAVPYLTDLLKRMPRLATAHRYLGNAHLAAGRTDAARECFRACLKIAPEAPAAKEVRKILEELDRGPTVAPR